MRRLTAVRSAALAAASLTVLTSCAGSGAGVRLEGTPTAGGPARADASAGHDGRPREGGTPSDGGTGAPLDGTRAPFPGATRVYSEDGQTDVIALLRRDPKVSHNVKKGLRPCSDDRWPVTVAYGRATGGTRLDLVVNVGSCATDTLGVGTYVYRRSSSGTLVDVFSAERPPVRAEFVRGRLVVTRDVFLGSNEPMCCPTGRDILTYRWRDGVFRQVDRVRTDVASQTPGPGDGGRD